MNKSDRNRRDCKHIKSQFVAIAVLEIGERNIFMTSLCDLLHYRLA
ncbi:hypothetical protein H1Q63_23485 [Desmonostoc muscorum CCALA 125]|nr:hypothetical protein [Desmonostoc muscorum CCALA 125]